MDLKGKARMQGAVNQHVLNVFMCVFVGVFGGGMWGCGVGCVGVWEGASERVGAWVWVFGGRQAVAAACQVET